MKDKIEFVSTLAGVSDMFPILPSSKYGPRWISKAMTDYKANILEYLQCLKQVIL